MSQDHTAEARFLVTREHIGVLNASLGVPDTFPTPQVPPVVLPRGSKTAAHLQTLRNTYQTGSLFVPLQDCSKLPLGVLQRSYKDSFEAENLENGYTESFASQGIPVANELQLTLSHTGLAQPTTANVVRKVSNLPTSCARPTSKLRDLTLSACIMLNSYPFLAGTYCVNVLSVSFQIHSTYS